VAQQQAQQQQPAPPMLLGMPSHLQMQVAHQQALLAQQLSQHRSQQQ
jgi:hypothetical protein